MTEPPEFLQSLLMSIESVAVGIKEEFPALNDKDVEWVYAKMKEYYKQVGYGKTPAEPDSTIERKGVMIDELLNIIDAREEGNADIEYINKPGYTNNGAPIPSLGAFYYMAFNRLEKSVRFWRKNGDFGGYLGYVSRFL